MSLTHVPAELRRLVRQRDLDRCEYCLFPQSAAFASHEVDHLVAEKHGGQTHEDNLALSCSLCNAYKGSDLTSIDPQTNQITPLFNPRREAWATHFQIVDARIEGLTPAGRVTARLLQFNHPDRIAERKLLLTAGLLI